MDAETFSLIVMGLTLSWVAVGFLCTSMCVIISAVGGSFKHKIADIPRILLGGSALGFCCVVVLIACFFVDEE